MADAPVQLDLLERIDVAQLAEDLAVGAALRRRRGGTGFSCDTLAELQTELGRGAANGFAPLDSGLLVPVAYLPAMSGSTSGAAGTRGTTPTNAAGTQLRPLVGGGVFSTTVELAAVAKADGSAIMEFASTGDGDNHSTFSARGAGTFNSREVARSSSGADVNVDVRKDPLGTGNLTVRGDPVATIVRGQHRASLVPHSATWQTLGLPAPTTYGTAAYFTNATRGGYAEYQWTPQLATVSNVTYVGSTVTVTTTTPHGFTIGQKVTPSGVVDSGSGATLASLVNVANRVLTGTPTTTSFTFTATATPTGTYVSGGLITHIPDAAIAGLSFADVTRRQYQFAIYATIEASLFLASRMHFGLYNGDPSTLEDPNTLQGFGITFDQLSAAASGTNYFHSWSGDGSGTSTRKTLDGTSGQGTLQPAANTQYRLLLRNRRNDTGTFELWVQLQSDDFGAADGIWYLLAVHSATASEKVPAAATQLSLWFTLTKQDDAVAQRNPRIRSVDLAHAA